MVAELIVKDIHSLEGIEDNALTLVVCKNFHRIPGSERGKFMDELFRAMAPGGAAKFQMPWYRSARAYQDFAVAWPPVTEASFSYFNKNWREQQGLSFPPYDLICDFEASFSYAMLEHWTMRSEEARAFASQSYWDVNTDLIVNLIKKA